VARTLNVSSTYLNWVSENTSTKWWHDSCGGPPSSTRGLERGAIGVTTNPVLASAAFKQKSVPVEHRDRCRTSAKNCPLKPRPKS